MPMLGDSQYRKAVYELIEKEPNLTTSEIAKRLNAPYSTIRIYHLEATTKSETAGEKGKAWQQLLYTTKPKIDT